MFGLVASVTLSGGGRGHRGYGRGTMPPTRSGLSPSVIVSRCARPGIERLCPPEMIKPLQVSLSNDSNCVEDILREMTHSWPPPLTAIHTPGKAEQTKFPIPSKDSQHLTSGYIGQKRCNVSGSKPATKSAPQKSMLEDDLKLSSDEEDSEQATEKTKQRSTPLKSRIFFQQPGSSAELNRISQAHRGNGPREPAAPKRKGRQALLKLTASCIPRQRTVGAPHASAPPQRQIESRVPNEPGPDVAIKAQPEQAANFEAIFQKEKRYRSAPASKSSRPPGSTLRQAAPGPPLLALTCSERAADPVSKTAKSPAPHLILQREVWLT
ncbi:hypothetical protein AAFF_G00017960 [Aldrovandia affinis]|uniref:Uncharacterized protein n=1 Tax=Aldrovandia affinis TaxID=143900 RepID=A0AAD7S5S5_9TELE|nr:hypothetical protein AAFF_G00017960 [Aldrovandia affinis]